MSIIKEFKDFAMRGNLIDLAIGVVLGTAFGKVITAFVDGMVMPLVGQLVIGSDLSAHKWVLKEASKGADGKDVPEVAVLFGDFLSTVLDFIVVAFAVFLVIKAMNKLIKKREEAPAAPPAPSKEELLLTEIRDLLKK